MNKTIISALVLAGMILGSNAQASDAREAVMRGGGNNVNAGSFYYDSMYNIFYNPVYINDMKNYVIFEKNQGIGTAASMHGFNMAVYFNRNNAFGTNVTSVGASGVSSGAYATAPVDFVIGGDAGVKWGLGLTYASNKVYGTDKTSSDLEARAGISMNGLEPFVGFHIIGKNGASEDKNKGFNIGARYHYGEWTPYFSYVNKKWEDHTGATTGDVKDNNWVVGLGREAKLGDSARLMYAVYYYRGKTESSDAAATGADKKVSGVPANVSVEADATSWLTLRAGATHNVIGPRTAGFVATTARVGGTFHMGKVDADFVFGNDDNSGAASTGGNIDTSSVGFSDDTFSKVSLRYSW